MKKKSTAFKKDLCKRTQEFRKLSGYTQEKMALDLGCSKDAYSKYETRTPLPANFLARFCLLTGYSPWQIMTGRASFDRDIKESKELLNVIPSAND
ncbi:helix-turn-helix transcriptional regulator [Candidatus Pacearchaeota archaeon]|nr:helix-turn-helix transcriptional regulator [Candidatus Pacearchaeota archaeon]